MYVKCCLKSGTVKVHYFRTIFGGDANGSPSPTGLGERRELSQRGLG